MASDKEGEENGRKREAPDDGESTNKRLRQTDESHNEDKSDSPQADHAEHNEEESDSPQGEHAEESNHHNESSSGSSSESSGSPAEDSISNISDSVVDVMRDNYMEWRYGTGREYGNLIKIFDGLYSDTHRELYIFRSRSPMKLLGYMNWLNNHGREEEKEDIVKRYDCYMDSEFRLKRRIWRRITQ